MKNDILLFTLDTSKKLTEKVAKILNVPIGEIEAEYFLDGEVIIRTLSVVKDKKCYVIHSTGSPANENIFKLLVLIDSLKSANAKEIILVMPYYGYSRQDRVAKAGEPITAKLVAKLYQAAGINRVIAIDLHTPQIQGFFHCPVTELSTIELFGDYFNNLFSKNKVNTKEVVVVSPDHGSALRARDLGSMFDGASIAFIDKRRPAPNKSEVINLVGDVKNKICIIIDDIIDTCETMNNATKKLLECGAKEIYVCATHAVFSKSSFDKRIKTVVTTDTIEKDFSNVTLLSVAPIIAEAIKNDN